MAYEKEREALKAAYSGPKWRQKVNKMSDGQVVAIHMRLKLQGKLKKEKK